MNKPVKKAAKAVGAKEADVASATAKAAPSASKSPRNKPPVKAPERVSALKNSSKKVKKPEKPILKYIADAVTDDPALCEMLIRYVKTDDTEGHLLAPLSARRKPNIVRELLDNRAAKLPADSGEASKLVVDTLSMSPERTIRITQRSGWYDGSAFVLPYRTFGKSKPQVYHRMHAEGAQAWLKPQGTLQDWKEGVAAICEASSYVTFAIGVALSGPLLTFLNQKTGLAFNLSGGSGAGKTTTLQLAQSVVGNPFPDERDEHAGVNILDVTMTALEELGYWHNDGFLPLDEFGAADLAPAESRKLIRAVSFKLRDGRGRIRSKAGSSVVGQSGLTWRVAVLTSSETSISEMAGDARGRGEVARFIDISVPPREGKGVQDRRTDATEPSSLVDPAISAIELNHGVARKAFLSKMLKDVPKAKKKAISRCSKFVQDVSDPAFEQVQPRYKEAFGKVYAALCLAVDYGVVPFDRKHAKNCMLEVYRRSELQLAKPRALDDSIKTLAAVIDNAPTAGGEVTEDTWVVRMEVKGIWSLVIEPNRLEAHLGKRAADALQDHLLRQSVQTPDASGQRHRQVGGNPFPNRNEPHPGGKRKRPRFLVLNEARWKLLVENLDKSPDKAATRNQKR